MPERKVQVTAEGVEISVPKGVDDEVTGLVNVKRRDAEDRSKCCWVMMWDGRIHSSI